MAEGQRRMLPKFAERRELVHGSVFTEPAVFEQELEKIWYRGWGLRRARERDPEAERFRREVDRAAVAPDDARP